MTAVLRFSPLRRPLTVGGTNVLSNFKHRSVIPPKRELFLSHFYGNSVCLVVLRTELLMGHNSSSKRDQTHTDVPITIIIIIIIIIIMTYLLTPWCRVLLEELIGLQLVKKFPAFHGTRRFITALTSVRHLSLSWASTIQSIYPHPTSCRSIHTYLLTHLITYLLHAAESFLRS